MTIIDQKRIAIVGAGATGLAAIKQCIDYGHFVKCFEITDDIGGLWRYRESDLNDVASVAKSTTANTSKETSSFSDFPPPSDFPNYMHNSTLFKYFQLYAEHYNLRKHIHFEHQVIELCKNDDHSFTGKWKIKYKHKNRLLEEVFDGVMICSGHHVYPRIPYFPGQDKFQGEISHTHSYKKPNKYEDKNVVVVGFANSALDAGIEISSVAKQVYQATRRGGWIVTRIAWMGFPRDIFMTSRFVLTLASVFGKLWNTLIEKTINSYFHHGFYGIKPKHGICNQHPITNDQLFQCLISKKILIRRNIHHYTKNGVVFEDDENEYKVDAVVFGTGYEIKFPYIKDDTIFECINDRVELYYNVFNPNLDHPHTLAFIGLVSPLGPVFPVSEMQSRWFAALMRGDTKLPPKEQLKKHVKEFAEKLWNTFYDSPRNSIEVKFIPYMDEMAKMVGCKPNLWKIAFSDFKLWVKIFFGPGVSYQYRLSGPFSWSSAREAIMTVFDRVVRGMKSTSYLPEEAHNGRKNGEIKDNLTGNLINGNGKIIDDFTYHNGTNKQELTNGFSLQRKKEKQVNHQHIQ